jgi:NAD(P)-dependent dehydrogenase (short-subunit alcohol dehydrogenase family)
MPKVLITAMSGTGKSTALQILSEHGHQVVATDTEQWSHWITLPDGASDWIWREEAITELLAQHTDVEIDASAPIDRVVRQLEELT